MVVREMNFMRRNLGQIIVATAIMEDTVGWVIIAIIFGITGALFSTLLTVVVIAIVSEVPRLHWLAVVLSKRGEPVSR